MNGKLENNVTPARGRARFRPGHPVHVRACVRACVRARVCMRACVRAYVRASPLTHRSCRNAHYYLVSEIWLRSPFIKDLIDRRRLKRARPPSPFLRFALLFRPPTSYLSPSSLFLALFLSFCLSLSLNKLLSPLHFLPLPFPASVIKFTSFPPFFMRGRYLRSFVFRILIASSPNWIRCLSIFAFLLFSNFPARHFTPLTCIYSEYIVLMGSHPEHNKPPSALSVYLSTYPSLLRTAEFFLSLHLV